MSETGAAEPGVLSAWWYSAMVIAAPMIAKLKATGAKIKILVLISDGRPLVAMDALRADIQLRLPGMTVELQFERDGVLRTTEVELGSWDDFIS